jgi:DNA polymerase III gamma/tau subunit
VVRIAPDQPELIEASDEEIAELRALAERTDATRLRRMFRALVKEQEDLAWAPQPFAVLELAVVRLATMPDGDDVGRLLARLDALEKRLSGSDGADGGAAPQRRRRDPRTVATSRRRSAAGVRRAATPRRPTLAKPGRSTLHRPRRMRRSEACSTGCARSHARSSPGSSRRSTAPSCSSAAPIACACASPSRSRRVGCASARPPSTRSRRASSAARRAC